MIQSGWSSRHPLGQPDFTPFGVELTLKFPVDIFGHIGPCWFPVWGIAVTSSEIRAERINYGLSSRQFARLIGTSDRTVRGWEQGRNAVPGPVVHLLAVLRDMPIATRQRTIEKLMGM